MRAAVLAASNPTPWFGLLALTAMFLLPMLPRSFWEPRPRDHWRRTPHRPPRRPAPFWPGPHVNPQRTLPPPGQRQMPPRPWLSAEYKSYIAGQIPGTDGVYWPDRRRQWLYEHALGGGYCQSGVECGQRVRATQAHHRHYRTLFHERREDVALVCQPCHAAEEYAKDQQRARHA